MFAWDYVTQQGKNNVAKENPERVGTQDHGSRAYDGIQINPT